MLLPSAPPAALVLNHRGRPSIRGCLASAVGGATEGRSLPREQAVVLERKLDRVGRRRELDRRARCRSDRSWDEEVEPVAAGFDRPGCGCETRGTVLDRAGLAGGLAGRGRIALAAFVVAGVAAALVLSASARAGEEVVRPALSAAIADPAVAGADVFPSGGEISLELDLTSLGLGLLKETVQLSSEGLPDAIVQRGPLDPKTGTIETEILQLQLTGISPGLGQVFVNVGRDFGLPPSLGRIDNVLLDKNGRLISGHSSFDLFAEVFIPGRVADPARRC